MASGPITSWQIDGETKETVIDFILGGSTLQMVTAAMKLKDAYSLEGKLCPTESQCLGRLIRSPGSLRRREGSGAPKEEKRTNVFYLFIFLYIP